MFELIKLPYAISELEPVISVNTMSYHYGKHLQAYVDNLNKLVAGTELVDKPLEEIVKTSDGAIFNNAGQVLNHNLYFQQFASQAEISAIGDAAPKLHSLICRDFGSVEDFMQEFEQKGATLFGSGWVWLSLDADGKLRITQHANADNPLRHGMTPLLTFDVWEHAYYLDYQNRRVEYLHSLWQIIAWKRIEERLK
jgi:Fe-Mn family superoxide dismutase